MIHFGSFPNSKNISMFPLHCTWTKIEKKQNHWIGRRRVETGNLWKYMLGKKCMVSDYNVSLKKSIELQDPLPKQLTILATQNPKSWTRRVEWNPDISLWNLAPPFSVSLRVKIYRLAGTQIFFPFLLVRLEPSSRLTVTSWKVAPEATHFSIKFRHSINMNFWFCSLRGLQKKNHVPHRITSKRLS